MNFSDNGQFVRHIVCKYSTLAVLVTRIKKRKQKDKIGKNLSVHVYCRVNCDKGLWSSFSVFFSFFQFQERAYRRPLPTPKRSWGAPNSKILMEGGRRFGTVFDAILPLFDSLKKNISIRSLSGLRWLWLNFPILRLLILFHSAFPSLAILKYDLSQPELADYRIDSKCSKVWPI